MGSSVLVVMIHSRAKSNSTHPCLHRIATAPTCPHRVLTQPWSGPIIPIALITRLPFLPIASCNHGRITSLTMQDFWHCPVMWSSGNKGWTHQGHVRNEVDGRWGGLIMCGCHIVTMMTTWLGPACQKSLDCRARDSTMVTAADGDGKGSLVMGSREWSGLSWVSNSMGMCGERVAILCRQGWVE